MPSPNARRKPLVTAAPIDETAAVVTTASSKVEKTERIKRSRVLKPDDVAAQVSGNGARPDEVKDNIKSSANYSDEALLRLVNLTFDPLSTLLNFVKEVGINPDEAHLLGMTRINSSREALFWSYQIVREAVYAKRVLHKEVTMPVTQIQRIAFLLLRRSIPGECGPGFMLGVGIAQEQNFGKVEEDVEGKDF